jgi:tetratricopeptide (TPR) repeat protein
MVNQEKALAKQAKSYWDDRNLSALENLRQQPSAAAVPEVLYFAGLGLNALNKRREAIECWRKARELDPTFAQAVRALAYELMDQAPVEASELFQHLVGLRIANADDFASLGEIRVKQDRLGEARRWLDEALRLDPQNSLALLALATIYVQVRDPGLALEYLKKAAKTGDVDLSDLASDPEYEFLWHNREFERIVSGNRRA